MAYLVVFVAAAIPWLEVLLVVPAGIVAGLPAAPTAGVAAAGNLATLVPLVLAGDHLRARWRARRDATSPAPAPPSTSDADGTGHAPTPAPPSTSDADGTGHAPAPAPPSTSDADGTGRAPAPAPPSTSDADGTGRAPAPAGHRDVAAPRGARARRLMDRYGLPGLAALGPLLTGVHVAAVVALATGAPRRATLGWLTGGVVVWAVLAALATVAGLDLLVDPDDLPRLPWLGS